MNDGKSIDKTEAQPITESRSNNDAQGLDLRRRRLIRGAAGIAPVVLTLRSGAAAAALSGCAPTANGITTTDSNGVIANTTNVVNNAKCIASANLTQCGTSPSGTFDVSPMPGPNVKKTVSVETSTYYCGTTTEGRLTSASVVIVSAGNTSIVF